MPGVVDPQPLVEQRLREIDAQHEPRLQQARDTLKGASNRPARRGAKRHLRAARREHRQARREVQKLRGVTVAWWVKR